MKNQNETCKNCGQILLFGDECDECKIYAYSRDWRAGDTDGNDEIICPYCGADNDEIENETCYKCGKSFELLVIKKYSTYQK